MGEGKGSKKHGRNKRKPSVMKYKAEGKREKNKAKNIKKQAQIEARAKAKRLARTPQVEEPEIQEEKEKE